jgi:trehalose 6-phosphate synthase/phosphatase
VMSDKKYDFILAIGDDVTDEDMFSVLPQKSYTIKVGDAPTQAAYRLSDYREVKALIKLLAGVST